MQLNPVKIPKYGYYEKLPDIIIFNYAIEKIIELLNSEEKLHCYKSNKKSDRIIRLFYDVPDSSQKWKCLICNLIKNCSGGNVAWDHHRNCCDTYNDIWLILWDEVCVKYPNIIRLYKEFIDEKYQKERENLRIQK